MSIRVALILALTTLAACNGIRPAATSHEMLDEQTGSMVSTVDRPLVFARERIDVAAHARDYATLVAVELDQSGTNNDFLLLYRWSTVDRRMSPPPEAEAGALQILADGRTIDLAPLERAPLDLSRRKELHLPEHGDVVARGYKVEVGTLRYIATSRELTLRMPQEKLDSPFTIFEDGRKSLGRFVQRAGAP